MLTRDEREFAVRIGIKNKKGLLLYKGREAWSESELRDYKRELDDVLLFTRCREIVRRIIRNGKRRMGSDSSYLHNG